MSDQMLPCNEPCSKCGSADIHRRFYRQCETIRVHHPPENLPVSTQWVHRASRYEYRALLDCLIHECRCCGFSWDGPTKPTTETAS